MKCLWNYLVDVCSKVDGVMQWQPVQGGSWGGAHVKN